MQGKIIKGIAGFYYVNVEGSGLYECKAKGIFRNKKIKPLVGDNVEIDVLDEKAMVGNIVGILERESELIRPAVANADQAFVIFAAADPAPNFNLLDRFLVMMESQGIPTIICFNKVDRITKEEQERIEQIYENSGCTVLFTSVAEEKGLDQIHKMLEHKTTVLAGPSGVGKSSMINKLNPDANMETGSISEKIKRGRHTTRHSELFYLGEGTYIMDTPGFSSMFLASMEKEELKDYFPEFTKYADECRFLGCVHINEPNCAVKEAIAEGKIHKTRYENYKLLYEELKNVKKY
ncbi:MAG: ribosome small subunit-dependent GTPase A [Lachnospiraceae bacterium]|nr:ribosome small subunit-dependent GTPase A [Lachnospiraceae bacterium]